MWTSTWSKGSRPSNALIAKSRRLGVSVDTLKRNKDFAVVYKRGAESGRKSLRRMQFESALKGNVTMLIWLRGT
jgi:hypothetical protein